MSRHFLLDGYNITHQLPTVDQGILADQRLALIRWIEMRRPQGRLTNQVTVVFDGQTDIYGTMPSSTVKVIFTSNETADAMIKRIVTQSTNARRYVVVTDDRDIQYAVRALGAEILPVQAFLKRSDRSDKSSHRQRAASSTEKSSKTLPRDVEDQITKEFKSIWLKKNPPV